MGRNMFWNIIFDQFKIISKYFFFAKYKIQFFETRMEKFKFRTPFLLLNVEIKLPKKVLVTSLRTSTPKRNESFE